MATQPAAQLHVLWALIVLTSASSVASHSNGSVGSYEATVAEPPSLVQNLGVRAVEHDQEARGLQLYVNWTTPTEGPLPKWYSLRVKSINESSDYCGTMDYDEDHINSTVTWFVVPPVVSVVEHDPRVLHECTYNVRVESMPYGGRRAAELNYTVPELVGSLWSCRQSAALPLVRDLRVSVVNHTAVDVSWDVDAAEAQAVQGFSLRLGTEIVSPLEDWFEYGPEVLLEAGSCSGGSGGLRMEHRLEGNLLAPVQYVVQVTVVDGRGCRGPPKEARFHTTGSGSTSVSQTLLLVVLPVVLLAAAAALVAALVCRGRGWWGAACGGRPQQQQQDRPWLHGYSTVAAPHSNGHSSFSDVTSHPETEMEVSYASEIELLGIKTRCDDV